MSSVPTKKTHLSGALLYLEGSVLYLFWCGFLPTSTGCHFAENTPKCCREKTCHRQFNLQLRTRELSAMPLKKMFSQFLRGDDGRCHTWDIQVGGLNCMEKTNIWGKFELSETGEYSWSGWKERKQSIVGMPRISTREDELITTSPDSYLWNCKNVLFLPKQPQWDTWKDNTSWWLHAGTLRKTPTLPYKFYVRSWLFCMD